jgi:hypothetical protein
VTTPPRRIHPRRWLHLAVLTSLFSGCAALTADTLRDRYGPPQPDRYDQRPAPLPGVPSWRAEIQPILASRCVVCHGCYDAPCQLKLGSWDGLARGLTQASVYGDLRLEDAPTTRLGIDAQKASDWRARGFAPVLDERTPGPVHPLEASLLWRVLQLKDAHPLPAGQAVLSTRDFAFGLDRDNQCPDLAGHDRYAKAQPLAGMPYGLPAIEPSAREAIGRWLAAGAPAEPAPPPSRLQQHQVQRWEALLNGDSLKQRLAARYLYEHLFLGHLAFDDDPQRQFFRIVRSRTPPGRPVEVIATRRPFDDPGPGRVWYRLQADEEVLLAKTHMPYVLSDARMARWRRWFLDADYRVTRDPGHAPAVASNPFLAFDQIPLESRYRFLLDDAGYFVMNFIKGPVCRGQIALNVIRDRFWVFFVDPAVAADDDGEQSLQRAAEVLRMPAAEGPNASLLAWRDIARAEDALLRNKSRAMAERYGAARRIGLDFVWDGDGHNANAALTIFRHVDSATVERGLIGEPPQTAWVIGYPLLERIYYLLAAGFDVWGNTAHQLQTRLAMDFLRMEGEASFLSLLPQAARLPLRDAWYDGASDEVKRRVIGGVYRFDAETGIALRADASPRAQQEQLYALLRQRLRPVLTHRHDLDAAHEPDAVVRAGIAQLAAVRGASLRWWPEATVLRIERPGQDPAQAAYYSVLRDVAHRNVSTLLREERMLVPERHALTVVPGFIGAYPNAILRVRPDELPALARAATGLAGEADWRALADRWAVRRTAPDFWATSDAMHAAYRRWSPGEAGLLDLNRLENR